MPEETTPTRHTLGVEGARQLAVVTKTVPMMEQITPRWLITFLAWVPVEAGRYRVNKVKPSAPGTRTVECGPGEEVLLPEIYVDYEENPREYTLSAVTTTLDVHTRISDLYRSPHDQIREQLRLIIERSRSARKESWSTTRITVCLTTLRPTCISRPERAHPRRTTWMSSSRRSGRSQLSSLRTLGPLRPLDASALTAAFHRRP